MELVLWLILIAIVVNTYFLADGNNNIIRELVNIRVKLNMSLYNNPEYTDLNQDIDD